MTAAITVTELGKTYVVPEREGGVRAALVALVKRRTPGSAGGRWGHLRDRGGGDRRIPRAERGRQDHHIEDAGRAAAPDHRHCGRARLYPVAAGPRLPGPNVVDYGSAQPAALGHPGARLLPAQPGDLPHSAGRVPRTAGRTG